MRAMTIAAALIVAFSLAGPRALGQETIAAPTPLEGASVTPGSNVQSGDPTQSILSGKAVTAAEDNGWRYRWQDGRWWYWTSQNRWMWYNDQGQWVDFNANNGSNSARPYTAAYRGYSAAPAYGYSGGNYTGAYPYPRVYPGASVGITPYGGVNIGAGRVGVNVWGGHGSVQAGRFGIGW